jgi:hypothetical protein
VPHSALVGPLTEMPTDAGGVDRGDIRVASADLQDLGFIVYIGLSDYSRMYVIRSCGIVAVVVVAAGGVGGGV